MTSSPHFLIPPAIRRRSGHRIMGRSVALIALALTGAFALSSCAADTTAATGSSDVAESAPPTDQGGFAPLFGEIAAVSGSLLQVRDSESQTAVTVTADTEITTTIDGSFDDVTIGSCVSARPDVGTDATGADLGTDATGADGDTDPGGDDDTRSEVADEPVSSVTVTTAVDGECSAGFGGMTPPEGTDDGPPEGEIPDDLPEGMPEGMPEGGPEAFGFAPSGTVTATSAGSITVESIDADGAATSSDILVDDSTTYTVTVTTDEAALVVGTCVSAVGESDDSGGLTADSIAVSEATDDGCQTATGRGMMGDRGAGGAPSGAPGDRQSTEGGDDE